MYDEIGTVPIADLTRVHRDNVMRQLPSHVQPASRRHVGQVIHRVLGLAELAGYIERTPLPRGWLPRRGTKKSTPVLFPAEDKQLLACAKVPLLYRILYGFLHREGVRRSEAARLTWQQLDLTSEVLQLDVNKTDHARWWKLSPGVAPALEIWFELRGQPAQDSLVFVDLDGQPRDVENLARHVRRHLERGRESLAPGSSRGARTPCASARTGFATRSRRDPWRPARPRTGSGSARGTRRRSCSRTGRPRGRSRSSTSAMSSPWSTPSRSSPASAKPPPNPSESLAERVGVEPTVPFRVHLISNQAPSATRSSLHLARCPSGPCVSTRVDCARGPTGLACGLRETRPARGKA